MGCNQFVNSKFTKPFTDVRQSTSDLAGDPRELPPLLRVRVREGGPARPDEGARDGALHRGLDQERHLPGASGERAREAGCQFNSILIIGPFFGCVFGCIFGPFFFLTLFSWDICPFSKFNFRAIFRAVLGPFLMLLDCTPAAQLVSAVAATAFADDVWTGGGQDLDAGIGRGLGEAVDDGGGELVGRG